MAKKLINTAVKLGKGTLLPEAIDEHKSLIYVQADRQFINVPENWAKGNIQLNNTIYTVMGNKLRKNGNRIVIGKGVAFVKVSLGISIYHKAGTGDKGVSIHLNGTEIKTTYESEANAFGWVGHTITNILLNVKENDYIDFHIWSGLSGSYEMLASTIMVEVIQ